MIYLRAGENVRQDCVCQHCMLGIALLTCSSLWLKCYGQALMVNFLSCVSKSRFYPLCNQQ